MEHDPFDDDPDGKSDKEISRELARYSEIEAQEKGGRSGEREYEQLGDEDQGPAHGVVLRKLLELFLHLSHQGSGQS